MTRHTGAHYGSMGLKTLLDFLVNPLRCRASPLTSKIVCYQTSKKKQGTHGRKAGERGGGNTRCPECSEGPKISIKCSYCAHYPLIIESSIAKRTKCEINDFSIVFFVHIAFLSVMRRFLASNSLAILSLIAIKNSQRESREGQGARVHQSSFCSGPVVGSRRPCLDALQGEIVWRQTSKKKVGALGHITAQWV